MLFGQDGQSPKTIWSQESVEVNGPHATKSTSKFVPNNWPVGLILVFWNIVKFKGPVWPTCNV